MTGLGERLKEARIAKGYSLDDLQEITKIQKRYLVGIENEEYGSMPGSFYVRAFIKQYAEAVELDVDEMLSLYQGSTSSVENIEEERQLAAPILNKKRARDMGQLSEAMPKIIVALGIIVILAVIVFLWSNNPARVTPEQGEEKPIQFENQKKNDAEKKPVAEDKEDEEKEKEEKEEKPEEQVLEHENDAGENSTYVLTKANEFKLEIRTSEDSWIGVLDASQVERTPEARVMKNGEKIELDVSNTESVRIRVGRTSATEIYVNGELLKYATDAITQNIIIEYKKEE